MLFPAMAAIQNFGKRPNRENSSQSESLPIDNTHTHSKSSSTSVPTQEEAVDAVMNRNNSMSVAPGSGAAVMTKPVSAVDLVMGNASIGDILKPKSVATTAGAMSSAFPKNSPFKLPGNIQ